MSQNFKIRVVRKNQLFFCKEIDYADFEDGAKNFFGRSRDRESLFVIFSGKNAFFLPSIPTLSPNFFWLFCSFLGITNDEPRGKCN